MREVYAAAGVGLGMNLVGDMNSLGAKWSHASEPCDRWTYESSSPGSSRVVTGDDLGSGLHAIWGRIEGPTEWNFGGSCVHLPGRARVLAEQFHGVLTRREVKSRLGWSDYDPWGHFLKVKRSRSGEFDLMVRSSPTLITNGRMVSGAPDSRRELMPNEEVVECWCWWVSISDDRRTPWWIKSWTAFRDVRVAISYAERIAATLEAEGFGLSEIYDHRHQAHGWRSPGSAAGSIG